MKYLPMVLSVVATLVVIVALALLVTMARGPLGVDLSMQSVNGVECVVYAGPSKGGVSCNWEKYNREHP